MEILAGSEKESAGEKAFETTERGPRIVAGVPALVLAPMDGVTDAPMRAVMGECGAFRFAVSEFLRVSQNVIPPKLYLREVPELCHAARTPSGLPVQVQLLGGDPGRMAASAVMAVETGATAIDINFGCPAPTVNRHDGGAALLKYPARIRAIVAAVRDAVPAEIPVSAKLRLGWDSLDAINENARMAAEGGANWITIHGRTRVQNYAPPAYWEPIGRVCAALDIPVVANGDIQTLDGFRRCRDITGCEHFMLGRAALANPPLAGQIARELGIEMTPAASEWNAADGAFRWTPLLRRLLRYSQFYGMISSEGLLKRLKQWLKWAELYGDFRHFDAVKRMETPEELFAALDAFAESG